MGAYWQLRAGVRVAETAATSSHIHTSHQTGGDGEVRGGTIVRIAASLFSRRGYTSTSIREVAEAVGLSKAGLYHHFATKEAILAEIADRAIDALTTHLERALATQGTVEDRLRDLVIGRVEVIAENYDALKVFWQERALIPDQKNVELDERMRQYHHEVLNLIEEGQRLRIIRQDLDPHMAMLGLLGMTGWTYLWYKPSGRLSAREIGEHFWSLLSGGLLDPDNPDFKAAG
jgi:AcrR family transcriptional regulator